jgi:hypothetical protein
MRKEVFENIVLKLIALVLAIITWFYISGEMKRQAAGLNASYSTEHKP